MGTINYKKIYAMKKQYEEKLRKVCPTINNESGIYAFTRVDDLGIRHCYLGQALHIADRCVSHFMEYDHIALSLKKRGIYSEENPYGWKLSFKNCPKEQLDENEIASIKKFADDGYQLLNATGGGQGKGKQQLNDYKQPKTYMQGIQQGYKNASKEIAHLFDLHLNVSTKSEKPTVNQAKALEKFKAFLEFHKKEGE